MCAPLTSTVTEWITATATLILMKRQQPGDLTNDTSVAAFTPIAAVMYTAQESSVGEQ